MNGDEGLKTFARKHDGAASPASFRMLAVVTDAYGGYGGIAQHNRDFLGALAQSGLFRVIRVLPRLSPMPSGELPGAIQQESPILCRFLYAARALVRTLQIRPDVILNSHLHHSGLSLILARLVGAKLISQLHGTEVWTPLTRLQRKALEASDLIFTVSRDTRARTLAQLTSAPERVVVLNNTFGGQFCPGDRMHARGLLGLNEEVVILTVARLDDRNGYKGHDRVIQMLPLLAARGHDVAYLIAGQGPDRQRLENMAANLGVSQRVRFLGMVKDQELPDLYRAADLFALPSTGEGFGIAFVEAMACGTPAIGLSIGGSSDALADGLLGTCVDPDVFPEALIAAIETCRSGRSELPVLIRERFGQESYARELTEHMRSLLF